jgi:amino acid transporter
MLRPAPPSKRTLSGMTMAQPPIISSSVLTCCRNLSCSFFVVALIFALDTITKFVNFGALTAFMALNISVIAYFFVRQGRRSGRDFIFYLLFPLLGFLIIFYVWFNFDVGTFIFGTMWLAAGIIIGAIKTKGFREKPAVLQEL